MNEEKNCLNCENAEEMYDDYYGWTSLNCTWTGERVNEKDTCEDFKELRFPRRSEVDDGI